MKNFFSSRMANKNRKGFTLVEIVVVILIIAILTGAVFLGGATVVKQSREAKVKTDLRNMATYVQDMMYDNPELQFASKFSAGGGTAYNASTKSLTAPDKDNATGALNALTLLNKDYLTADFQMSAKDGADDIETIDAWKNPYLFSFEQIPSTNTGDSSSCIIVINSIGTNAKDETSDQSGNADALADVSATKSAMVAKIFAGEMGNDSKTYTSAQALVDALDKKDAGVYGDDYGVVICMIDGQVSTAYYGF